MSRLRVLSIHGGLLERLPLAKELGTLKELEIVRAVHLAALPDDIGKLQALKKVVVVGCAKTASINGFDGALFAALVREVWASERHVKLRGEWF